MNIKKQYLSAVVLVGASLLSGPYATARATLQNPQQPAADNTKMNQRDRDQSSPTADQQKMNPSDSAISKKIRMAIHQDSSLSTYGHNVKIITQGGKVTLKGPVRSEEEKNNIAAKAVEIAGDGNVDNQLEIAPSKQ